MALIFNLYARCITFFCIAVFEILCIIFVYQLKYNPSLRVRVNRICPRLGLETSEFWVIEREIGKNERNDTNRKLARNDEESLD